MEQRSSFFFSSSPNFPSHNNHHNNNNNISYFSHQAIRAGFPSTDPRRREFHRNPNDIRECIQRELEKERIRAEIIAEEVYRRRILEDEVRREMMYEREMALRRGKRELELGPPRRVPLLTNVEHRIGDSPQRELGFSGSRTLPFQRDPVVAENGNVFSQGVTLKEIKELKGPSAELSKDKVIFLAKPNATDLKRKATTPPIGASADPSAGLKKPKTQEDWSCALCRITTTSERALNDHLQGKKHKARESGLNSQRTGFGTGPLPKTGSTTTGKPYKVPSATNESSIKKKDEKVHNAPKQLPGTDNKFTRLPGKETCVKKKENSLSAMPQKSPVSAKAKNKLIFFCDVCQVSTHALRVLNAHKRGKRHLAKVAQLNKINEGASGESSAQKGVVEERKENKETYIAGYVEKAVVEEKKELDFTAAVEEMKNESSAQKGVVEERKENKETDIASYVEKAVVEEKKELDFIAAVEEMKNESSAQKGVVEERKENKETDIASYVEKAVVEEKKELDFTAAVEEMKNETTEVEQVKSNKETIDCDVTGVEEDEVKVLEIVGDILTGKI